MSLEIEALKAPTQDTYKEWLNTPRLARCGEFFTPSEPMWWPDKVASNAVNWQPAISCVPSDWQHWLHVALAYRMVEVAQRTVGGLASVLSRAAESGFDPLNEDHLIDLRDRFNVGEFSNLCGFMRFWQGCESLEQRPSRALIDAYKDLPKKSVRKTILFLVLIQRKGRLPKMSKMRCISGYMSSSATKN